MTQDPLKQVVTMKENADVFMAFQKHREKFLVLLEAGVFDVEAGKIEINIHNAQIQNINIPRMTYKRHSLPQKGMIL